MAGAGVELRLDVPDTGVPEALDGPPDSGGALAHRVGVTGEEEQGQVLTLSPDALTKYMLVPLEPPLIS